MAKIENIVMYQTQLGLKQRIERWFGVIHSYASVDKLWIYTASQDSMMLHINIWKIYVYIKH